MVVTFLLWDKPLMPTLTIPPLTCTVHFYNLLCSLQAEVTVPGQHSCHVSIVARQMLVDVPYDATVTVYFPDDSTITEYITGVYEGLSVSQDTVVIDACIPL